ncbi:MAG: Ribonuclease HII [Candidatus Uhrbacteria bacterium GW2011_GWA2_52_8d]|uniref:Ribonuclease HII n=1 Tax=Candidatus Uhrbacteria bacterium GW2011_GWA2_52_8d TaxID=1618979 RepID=A0A0G1XRD9_9BACT|nr:MAG: Ribonuclease HII [Candidatus Uhrbacteria bacterium GW2011_GWA2_52_8d]
MSIKSPPTFKIERELLAQGFQRIVGVDEAGCGALAGPVVAAAVILPVDSRLGALRDSKLLSQRRREELYPLIIERAVAWSVGMASVDEIERLNIRGANLLAMRRAVEAMDDQLCPIGQNRIDYVLVDAWTIPGVMVPQRGIIRGDLKVKSIAAASVIAKVTRDRLMAELAREFPVYGFEVHKGYATKVHRTAIALHGPCSHHRLGYKTFVHV